ncbi:hypothetical protein EYF80_016805 [Liparis tanakae]|uniref:Uncharacterized protein n=1 Tax=Liparis tanakae TaxID=230148 RepID=A0A4Z2I477_9TELE|nr:hypothetical protein EYF80_016805 [Liparis tanakae]
MVPIPSPGVTLRVTWQQISQQNQFIWTLDVTVGNTPSLNATPTTHRVHWGRSKVTGQKSDGRRKIHIDFQKAD